MSLRRTLSKRFFTQTTKPAAAPPLLRRNSNTNGFFRRLINNHSSSPVLLTLPLGENLREKLKSLNDQRLRLDGLSPPRHRPELPQPERVEEGKFSVNVADAKRVMRFVQLEKVRSVLSNIPANTVTHGEFVRICGDVVGSREMGAEFAKALDDSGNVIVLGGVVFLHPDQVARTMENLISQTIAMPNDTRRKELDNLEDLKALIDKKAKAQAQTELYCGLGFLLMQTLGFMRLTFWELTWDVMEPICYFVASFYFALSYGFFLKTSKEPSFESFFQRRFRVKQEKLMKVHNFDVERYNQLRGAFYPEYYKPGYTKVAI